MDKTGNRWFKGFMIAATVLLLGVSLSGWHNQSQINERLQITNSKLELQVETLNTSMKEVKATLDTLRETHPYIKKWKGKKLSCASGAFFGFLLYTPVDTSVSEKLIVALSDYSGPKAKINSLRRHYNHKSKHFCGKAVDLAWDENVISFLVSEEGRMWLQKHNITFYIEGRPGSSRVKKYLGDPVASQYVFFNESATADHIHLNV